MATEKRLIDLTGRRFGKLVVISRESKYNRTATWRCLCDCGKETVVRGDVLKRGTTQSCGCGKGLKHGYFYEPWYPSYKAMMERCYLPSSGNYQRYGGKGVAVCEEWHDINNFAEWVKTSGYAPGLTIDRIDPLGNYEPSNCQWLTRSENSKKQFADREKRGKEMVEVVRCKDCKHYMAEEKERCEAMKATPYGICIKHCGLPLASYHEYRNEDDFCSYGERKDNGR